jgi:hypothetical protein
MQKKIETAWERLHTLKYEYMAYQKYTYDQMRELTKPHLDIINERGREVSRKYKMPYRPLTFSKFMR